MTMKAQKLIRLSCILFSLCGLFSASLFADNQSSTQDRLAISEMLAQYSYRWDSKDSMGFAGLFTTDAVMEHWQRSHLSVCEALARRSSSGSPNAPPLFRISVSRTHQPNGSN